MAWRKSLWAKVVFSSSAFLFGSARKKRPYRTRLLLEVLEDRTVPTTITPTMFADGVLGSGSLRDAVLQFNADTGTDDDTIQLEAGTYSLTIQNDSNRHEQAGLTGDLNLTRTSHRWSIQGAGPSTVIDASQLQDRVFQIVNPGTQVVFKDLVIQGGLAEDDGSDGALAGTTDALGGGILNNAGNITLDHVVVQNNLARAGDSVSLGTTGHNARGGGVYSTGGALTMTGATLANNNLIAGRGGDHNDFLMGGDGGSATGGGLFTVGSSLDIANSMIANNRATGGDGGQGGITAYSHYRGAGDGGSAAGGGLYATAGSLDISNTMIASNRATGGTGGPPGVTYSGSLGLGGNGGAGHGGGLYVNGGSVTIASSTIASNQGIGGPASYGGTGGNSEGGGLYNGGTLTVSNTTLSSNSAVGTFRGGGGIYNQGTLTVSNTTLSGNSAAYSGGGIYNTGTLTVSNSTLAGNSASAVDGPSAAGGGICNLGTLTVSNSTLAGNFASYWGGGIYNVGTLTVSNSTLAGNSAVGTFSYGGGGICNLGTLTVSNTTLSGNSASGIYGRGGGGIYNVGTFPVTLTNVTLTANRANTGFSSHGGGLSVNSGSPVLQNTLIAGNFNGATGTTRDDVYGAVDASGDYNLIGDGTGTTGLSDGVNGNHVGSASSPIDPLLGPLQDNGGPTLTHALRSGSPAIDAGNNLYATDWDQRGEGFPRIVNGIIDIGAFEFQSDGSAPLFTRSVRGDEPAAGAPFDVTVKAVDVFGQVAFGYRGTVTFSVTDPDPAVMLPADYTFTADDQGTHRFTGEFTLFTPGMWTLTTADLANGLSQDVMMTVDS
jgi:hypothetical protein